MLFQCSGLIAGGVVGHNNIRLNTVLNHASKTQCSLCEC